MDTHYEVDTGPSHTAHSIHMLCFDSVVSSCMESVVTHYNVVMDVLHNLLINIGFEYFWQHGGVWDRV